MRTTLNLSDELISELEDLAEGKTKTQIFTEALEDYIRKKRKERLLALRGKISLDYDWKAEEEKELLSVKEERKKYGKRRSR
jgi:metal-responsive CopG/Arc/MetJ family transcriptional regulator